MTQQAHKEDSPVVLVPKRSQVTPVLGRIEVHNADLSSTHPKNNSTRWIFDVEGRLDTPVIVQLVDSRSGHPLRAHLIAGSFLPRSPEFYVGRPFIQELDDGKLVLTHTDTSVSCRYRVCVDTMHSATR